MNIKFQMIFPQIWSEKLTITGIFSQHKIGQVYNNHYPHHPFKTTNFPMIGKESNHNAGITRKSLLTL